MRKLQLEIIHSVLAIFLASGNVLAQSSSQQSSSTNTLQTQTGSPVTVKEKEKPWSLLLGADQYFGFYKDNSQYTEITINPTYILNDRNTFTLVQAIDKYYEIPAIGGEEVSFSDTSLRHILLLNPDLYGWNLKWRTSATIPLSTASRDNRVITRVGVMAMASRKFLDIFTFSYKPFLSNSFNEYTTTVGGTPLKRASIGNYIEGQIDFTDKLNLFGRFIGSYSMYEKTNNDSNPRRLNGDYIFEAYLSYALLDSLNAQVGYSTSDAMIKEGRYEINVFDYQQSRWLLGVAYTF